jgi:tRNA 2-thiouridine synthesizing protein A
MAGAQSRIAGEAGRAMRTLDASGLNCPLPVLKTRKILMGMRAGEQIQVITTDAMSVVDMPVFCAQAGHRIVSEEKRDDDFIFVIERGP